MDRIEILEQQIKSISQKVEQLALRRITQIDIIPGVVKQRHVDGLIIFTGLEVNLPNGSTEVQAYFAVDTNKLYLYGQNGWVSVTLS